MKKITVSRRDNIRALVLIAVVAGVPILGTIYVTASTSEPDLSDLTPISQRAGNYLVLNWSVAVAGSGSWPEHGNGDSER